MPEIAATTPEITAEPTVDAAVVENAPTPAEIAPAISADAPAETTPVTTPAESAPVTVLGDAPKDDEIKVENKDTASVEEAKDEEIESSQSDDPAPLPTYDDLTLPEGMERENIGEFTSVLGEFEKSTKADHAEVNKLGQALLERHVAEVKKVAQVIIEEQHKAFETKKSEWLDSFVKDPEIGGNRQETTANKAREFIATHGGTSEQQKEIRELMNTTGLGNHPAVIRLLANAMKGNEEGKPLPATRPVPTQKSKVQARYGIL